MASKEARRRDFCRNAPPFCPGRRLSGSAGAPGGAENGVGLCPLGLLGLTNAGYPPPAKRRRVIEAAAARCVQPRVS